MRLSKTRTNYKKTSIKTRKMTKSVRIRAHNTSH